jgi:hypothetical protein
MPQPAQAVQSVASFQLVEPSQDYPANVFLTTRIRMVGPLNHGGIDSPGAPGVLANRGQVCLSYDPLFLCTKDRQEWAAYLRQR